MRGFFYLLFLSCVHLLITTTLSDFRKDIKSYFNRVTESFDTLIVNRGKDSGVVIMSLEEYNSLKSTQHELSSRKNQQRLDESIESLKVGKKPFQANSASTT